MDYFPAIPLVLVGALVLAGHRGIASVFTSMQQQDRWYAHPRAGFFQKLNTLLFGLALVVMGVVALLR